MQESGCTGASQTVLRYKKPELMMQRDLLFDEFFIHIDYKFTPLVSHYTNFWFSVKLNQCTPPPPPIPTPEYTQIEPEIVNSL